MSKKEAEKSSRIKPAGGADWFVFFLLLGAALWLASWMNTGENPFGNVPPIQPGSVVEMIYVR